MLPSTIVTLAWCGASRVVVNSRAPVRARLSATAIEATLGGAEAQRAEFFALMPSEKLPGVSLDLRLFASKEEDHFQAKVFARQEGTAPQWKDVGTVAVEKEAQLGEAVSKQRSLIARWAYEAINDFETNELLLDLGAPLELAYATRPPKAPFWEKQAQMVPVPVAEGAPFAPALRCGFLGKISREYRGGGATARYERIVLGQPPETPEARNEHWGASNGPYGESCADANALGPALGSRPAAPVLPSPSLHTQRLTQKKGLASPHGPPSLRQASTRSTPRRSRSCMDARRPPS